MRFNPKIALGLVGATLLLGASAATAYAAIAQRSVALQVGEDQGTGFTGTYGTQVTLQPASMSSIELPGDKFHFQAYVMDVETSGTGIPTHMVWKDFRDFEDIQLEDTNTVAPFAYQLGIDDAVILSDGSVITPTFPYLIRAEYKPSPGADASGTPIAGSSTAPASFSETETVSLIKNMSTKVSFAKSGTVRRAGTTFNFRVSPNCGPGKVRVTVSRSGMTARTYTVNTDEDGRAMAKLKLGTRYGTYKVTAKFLGNIYGVASAPVTHYYVANN